MFRKRRLAREQTIRDSPCLRQAISAHDPTRHKWQAELAPVPRVWLWSSRQGDAQSDIHQVWQIGEIADTGNQLISGLTNAASLRGTDAKLRVSRRLGFGHFVAGNGCRSMQSSGPKLLKVFGRSR